MKRALHIFPAFSSDSGVQAFRVRHDPLALCIPPHITLLFPFEDEVGDEELVRHIKGSVQRLGSFAIGFAAPVVVDDRLIWLPVRDDVGAVADLHARLYGSIMRKHHRTEIPYRPHVTLGVAREDDAAELLREAEHISLAAEYRVENLVLERIGADQQSDIIAMIPLYEA
jgi:2'-5' RNA ligase